MTQIEQDTIKGVKSIMASTTDLPTDIPLLEVGKIITQEFDNAVLTLLIAYHLGGRKQRAIRDCMKRIYNDLYQVNQKCLLNISKKIIVNQELEKLLNTVVNAK